MLHNRNRTYIAPVCEPVLLEAQDILTASGDLPELIVKPDGDGDVFEW